MNPVPIFVKESLMFKYSSLQNHQLWLSVEDKHSAASERITDKGSAIDEGLDSAHKGCTDQEIFLDVVNGLSHQKGSAILKRPDRSNSMGHPDKDFVRGNGSDGPDILKGSGSGKAPVRKMVPERGMQSGGHKESGRNKRPDKEHMGMQKCPCRKKGTDIDKNRDRDEKNVIYTSSNTGKKSLRYKNLRNTRVQTVK